MNPDNRELLRQAILQVLEAADTRFGLGETGIATHVIRFGFRLGADAIRPEVQYLVDKGLVVPVTKTLSPENRMYRITAQGRDFLATEVGA